MKLVLARPVAAATGKEHDAVRLRCHGRPAAGDRDQRQSHHDRTSE
jgi:hypothetical protein